MQGRLNVDSLKRALVMDIYTVQWAVPSKSKPQTRQTDKEHTKPQQNQNHKAQKSGIATSSEK